MYIMEGFCVTEEILCIIFDNKSINSNALAHRHGGYYYPSLSPYSWLIFKFRIPLESPFPFISF